MVSLIGIKVHELNWRSRNEPRVARRLSLYDKERDMEPIKVQGVLVRVEGVGVLIRGPSGSGKSLAALHLMDRGYFFVSDDLVEISAGSNGRLMGSAVEESPRIEVRGLGVFHAASLYPGRVLPATRLDMVVELDRYQGSQDAGILQPDLGKALYLGLEVPRVRVPVAPGFDPAVLVLLLVRHLLHMGVVNC